MSDPGQEVEMVRLFVDVLLRPPERLLQTDRERSTRATPHDYVTNQPTGKAYFVSTARTGNAGYQTAIFDSKGFARLLRPLLRVCLMNKGSLLMGTAGVNAFYALRNHVIVLIMVAEEDPSAWLKGVASCDPADIHRGEPNNATWKRCLALFEQHLVRKKDHAEALFDVYLRMRDKYHCSLHRE